MSIGLPGSGIGGVFYLASAVMMPMHSVHRKVRGDVPKVRLVVRQTALAVMIITMLWLTGVAIDWMLAGAPTAASLRSAIGSGNDESLPSVFRAASFFVTFGTLAGVLLLVQVLRLFVRPQQTPTPTEAVTHKKAA